MSTIKKFTLEKLYPLEIAAVTWLNKYGKSWWEEAEDWWEEPDEL